MSKRRKAFFMETTEVPAGKTVMEILGSISAYLFVREVTQCYSPTAEIEAVVFVIIQGGCLPCMYRLPARWEPLFEIINGRRREPWQHREKDREHAKRVAWRQVLRWVQAQLALIETGMVAPQEVFMSYLLPEGNPQGLTAFDMLAASNFKSLRPAGEPEGAA